MKREITLIQTRKTTVMVDCEGEESAHATALWLAGSVRWEDKPASLEVLSSRIVGNPVQERDVRPTFHVQEEPFNDPAALSPVKTRQRRSPNNAKPSKAGVLLEKALFDTGLFPVGPRYPVFDLTMFGLDIRGDGLEADIPDGFWLDGWTDCLTRPLNFATLTDPREGDGWQGGVGYHIRQIDRKLIRGRAKIQHHATHAVIGRRHNLDKSREKIGCVNIRGLNLQAEAFRFDVFGDARHFGKHGKFSADLLVNKNSAFAVTQSGVVIDMRERAATDPSDHMDMKFNASADAAVRMRIRMSCGVQFHAEYLWRVVLQFDDGRPKLSFAASNSMVRSLLKLRTETDKFKKKRMLTIVRKHTRLINEEAACNVMRHYRGSLETLWQGCRMQIIPPVNETDSMEKFTNKIMEVRAATREVQPETVQ